MTLKGKIGELNKRTSEVKRVAVTNFKGSAEFEYEKRVAINEAILGMVWTLYEKSPSFDPSVLGPEVVRLVADFWAKEPIQTPADESTQLSEKLDDMLNIEPQVEQISAG